MIDEMGFGDFIFRLPDGKTEVARATDLNELETLLHTVPAESIAYHGERNHFSHWLMARTEFALAQKLRPRKVSDFGTLETLAPRSDRVHRRISPRAKPGADRRIQSGNLSARRLFLPPDRRRFAGRQSARAGIHSPLAASPPNGAQVSRHAHLPCRPRWC